MVVGVHLGEGLQPEPVRLRHEVVDERERLREINRRRYTLAEAEEAAAPGESFEPRRAVLDEAARETAGPGPAAQHTPGLRR
jgi:hypothetical protein